MWRDIFFKRGVSDDGHRSSKILEKHTKPEKTLHEWDTDRPHLVISTYETLLVYELKSTIPFKLRFAEVWKRLQKTKTV